MDREIIPIEVNIEREMNSSELRAVFENIKSKIGEPRNYGMTKEMQEEIDVLKQAIDQKKKQERLAAEKVLTQQALEEEEKKIEEEVKTRLILFSLL
jgi:hypothetical protein